MNILFVYAHPNPESFTASIISRLVEKAKEKNHLTEIRDLYTLKFDPILSSNDFEALRSGNIPADIKIEQDLISKADVVVMVYQLWWTQFPAMLKGYIDRVFSYGFAYQFGKKGLEGMLNGKKVFLVTNTGTPTDVYENSDMFSALNKTSNIGIFEYCGIDTIEHIFNGGVPSINEDARKEYLISTIKSFEDFL
jgi:NAD(P)H dehydrogenase (quinone)